MYITFGCMRKYSEMRIETPHRRWVRRGCYALIGLTVALVFVLPIDSELFEIAPILPSMEQDHLGLRAFAAILSIFSVLIYMIPTVVAYNRWHNKVFAIFLVNVCLGWTLLIWVGALVWALWNDVTPPISARGEVSELSDTHVYKTGIFTKLSVLALIGILVAMIYVNFL